MPHDLRKLKYFSDTDGLGNYVSSRPLQTSPLMNNNLPESAECC